MTEYRRAWVHGGRWFFTANLAQRRGNHLLADNIDLLWAAFARVGLRYPFRQEAFVIMPDHLHCIWTLPYGDTDFSVRWGLIKAQFSRGIAKLERISRSRSARGERGIWQRRFWEHLIRNDEDFNRHADYIHWNPVRHGWVQRVAEWPHSSFQDYVRRDLYPADWGDHGMPSIELRE